MDRDWVGWKHSFGNHCSRSVILNFLKITTSIRSRCSFFLIAATPLHFKTTDILYVCLGTVCALYIKRVLFFLAIASGTNFHLLMGDITLLRMCENLEGP